MRTVKYTLENARDSLLPIFFFNQNEQELKKGKSQGFLNCPCVGNVGDIKKKFRTLKQNNEICQEGNKNVTLKLASPFQNLKGQIFRGIFENNNKVSVHTDVNEYIHRSYRDFVQIIAFYANQLVSPFWHSGWLLSLSEIMCSEDNYELV